MLILIGLTPVVGLLGGTPGCKQRTPPAIRWETGAPLIQARSGAGAAAHSGWLYVAGGASAESGVLTSVEAAPILENGRPGPWTVRPPLSIPRAFLALASAPGSLHNTGYLYAVGGMRLEEGRPRLLETVEQAELEGNGRLGPWRPAPPMTTPRRGPAVIVHKGFLYAIGGYNGLFLDTVERARIRPDGSLGPWELLPVRLTTDRYIHGAARWKEGLYVVGGHIRDRGGGKNSAEWTTLGPDGIPATWRPGPPLRTPRFLAGVEAVSGRLFVIGGYNGGYLDSVEEAGLGPDGTPGAFLPATSLPSPREGAATVAVGDRLYVLGGSRNGVYLQEALWARVGSRAEDVDRRREREQPEN